MSAGNIYDSIGAGYTELRREDPRIAARIHAALGDARTVLNVGAGTGNYEPRDREVLAVEPSQVMRRQRPPGCAPCLEAAAEDLPFPDRSFDAVMAILSDHHWRDHDAGLAEVRRVARRRVVLFNFDPLETPRSWILPEYFPAFEDLVPEGYRLQHTCDRLGGARMEVVPIPHDCTDGFLHAYWRRPEAYLDPDVRAHISVFSGIDPAAVARGVEQLRRDLADGTWHRRHADLLELEELDCGYRLVVAEVRGTPAAPASARNRGTPPARP